MKRVLSVKREYVSELKTEELAAVAAAGSLTGVYPTINRPCPTVQPCIELGPIPTTNCFTGTSGHTVTCNTFAC